MGDKNAAWGLKTEADLCNRGIEEIGASRERRTILLRIFGGFYLQICVYLFIYLFVYLVICLFVYLFICFIILSLKNIILLLNI